MRNAVEVADDLYIVEQDIRPGWFCVATIILGNQRIGLVDTGFENTPEDLIFPLMEKLGRRPEEIDNVVNTHRDGDHVLGNSVIKNRTRAKIYIHELEFADVKTADIRLKDGDTVELGDRKFKVIHTPGHRPGSICLYDQKNRSLITGDSVCGDRTDLIRMDRSIYMNSLKKLLELDARVLIMSHPFQPLGRCVLTNGDTKRMIQASIDIADKLK